CIYIYTRTDKYYLNDIYIYIMSVYSLASRVSSIEYSVDELAHKADSNDAVLTGTTTINGLTFRKRTGSAWWYNHRHRCS
ncbi:MAG: hypothetical protein ACKPKO_13710, partial [Candidatus Fonsibacter sp.]